MRRGTEEWGLLGSTEWAEKHAQELSGKAVVYINTDSTSKGWLSVSGSHSLEAFANDLMRDLDDPKRAGKTLFQAKRDRAVSQAKTDDEKAKLTSRRDFPIDALGSGSDYTAFLDYLTVASLNMDFGGDAPDSGVYHRVRLVLLVRILGHRFRVYNAALSRVGTDDPPAGERRHPALRVHGDGAR